MSYDALIFDPDVAPRNREQFLAWCEHQSKAQESHDPNDPDVPAPALKLWFREIIKGFPPMNGPLAGNDLDNPRVTDYSLSRSVIHAAFSWSERRAAYQEVRKTAARHGVGFFDVSGKEGDIWWPVSGWALSCEAWGEIPLPLNLDFGENLEKLDPTKNSFVILESANGDFIQCGGSKETCTVEFRRGDGPSKFKHYVVGHLGGSEEAASVPMSGGEVTVRRREVLGSEEATELFEAFFAGQEVLAKYVLRAVEF